MKERAALNFGQQEWCPQQAVSTTTQVHTCSEDAGALFKFPYLAPSWFGDILMSDLFELIFQTKLLLNAEHSYTGYIMHQMYSLL